MNAAIENLRVQIGVAVTHAREANARPQEIAAVLNEYAAQYLPRSKSKLKG
jgi:hypothetical protein